MTDPLSIAQIKLAKPCMYCTHSRISLDTPKCQPCIDDFWNKPNWQLNQTGDYNHGS